MANCPHCGDDLRVPSRSFFNADQYSKSNISKTECCGRAVRVIPLRSYRFEAYTGPAREDDWGEPIRQIAK